MPIIILGIIIGVIFLFIIISINSLISKKNQVQNVFASIDAMLKKRYDLIPNLISTVQNYMKYEKQVLSDITQMRTKAMSGNLNPDEKVDLDNKIQKAIGGIMVAVENYPDLKANQNFLQLQAAMNEIEEQISAARRAYNASVTDYNNAVEMFPSSIFAGMMGYKRKNVFEISDEERKNVNAKELFDK
jgi:LemA protein